jgi:hypothetical protein
MSQSNLVSLIQNEREKAQHKRNHETHPAPGDKRNGFKKPDQGVLEFTGPGHGREKDCIAE